MVDVSNEQNSVVIKVTSSSGNTNVAAKSDTAQYWSNASKKYSEEAKESADQAKQAVNEVIDQKDSVIADIEGVRAEAVESVTDVANTGIAELEDRTNNLVNEINTTGKSYDNLTRKQITNCLLEVPQNIKLELNDGTLTLKAGSIVTVPNGFEADGTTPKFDYVTVASDVVGSYTNLTAIGNCLLTLNSSTNTLAFAAANGNNTYYFSGNTAPANPVKEYYWYDTANNLLKRYNGTAWVDGYTLPIALMSYNGTGVITSINQVFNGMGYIGSTVWVDKGVKGLIPNGRNEDGSLKNIEFVSSKVITHSKTDGNSRNGFDIVIDKDSVVTFTNTHYEVKEDGYIYNMAGTAKLSMFAFGTYSSNADTITSFQPKQPFRAVDYNDFDTKVNKAGDTMTGNLTIDNANQAIFTIDSDLAGLGSSPSGGKNTGSIYFKQQGVLTAIIQNAVMENGGNRLQFITRRPDNSGWGAGCNLATSATGASTFDFPRCTTKATTTSTASGSSVAVIVQNYKNGNSWYRVWSDGWIEQGGSFGEEYLSYAVKTFTFLKSFSDANYNVQATNGATGSFYCPALQSKTKTNFQLRDTVNYAGLGNWYACGY